MMHLPHRSHATYLLGWGDWTSRNDVCTYECSWTPRPHMNRPLWHNVPGLMHPRHYALSNTFWLVQNGRNVSMQGRCFSGTIHLGDQGSQNIRTGTHRFGTSCHPTSFGACVVCYTGNDDIRYHLFFLSSSSGQLADGERLSVDKSSSSLASHHTGNKTFPIFSLPCQLYVVRAACILECSDLVIWYIFEKIVN